MEEISRKKNCRQ